MHQTAHGLLSAAGDACRYADNQHHHDLRTSMTHSRRDSSKEPTDPSRRSFIALATAGAAGSLVFRSADSREQGSANDLTMLTLQDAADQLRRKRLSPVDLTKACLARIERLNPSLNAFITISAESAMTSARSAETEIQ